MHKQTKRQADTYINISLFGFLWGLGGVVVRVLISNLCGRRFESRALHVGKLVVTCRCPVVYSAVCTGFLHLYTTRCNMTLAVERDTKKNQINLNKFGFLCCFQYCTGHITMGSLKGRGNQYIKLVKVVYCKLLAKGKPLPT